MLIFGRKMYLSSLIPLFLLTGCQTTAHTYWDQLGPDQVSCPERSAGFKVMKVCRQYGPHLICKCVVN